eukprot:TRINITY_DN13982_c0_g1_i1.p2 TRINITY_DN13982_c0_g1~~TRINITY_DN13982_c0_g1_i1.p2  ORF type:complete len:369 (-),score=115.00 TRINITY_DN13982_c0_g1_i1:53-1159(-)
MSKPKILVLGGVGFIGRNLVTHLVQNDLASFIRVADKVLPATAFLGSPHKEAFETEGMVQFKQCNLNSDAGVNKAYTLDDGSNFDWVVNCAAETKYGQTDEVYKEKVLDLSVKVATKAAEVGVSKFIELSTAQVYSHGKKASKEDASIKPWTGQANYKYQAEEALRGINGLNLIILRPAIVYGPGDTAGISPRLITGAVYKHLGEKMKLLWSGDLRINCVHVDDVSRAIVHVAQNADAGAVYNLADKSDLTQEKLNKFIEGIFQIKTGFLGGVISNLAKVNLKAATEQVNEKHLKPWADICKADGILNTPLTPYIDTELLYNHALSVDGAAIEGTGFTYGNPTISEELLREQIGYFVTQNLFPASVVP